MPSKLTVEELQQRFGRRVMELRARQRLTQEQLARATGLSLQFIRKVEQGTRAVSFASLVRICRVLGPPAELFNFSDEPLAAPPVETEWLRLRELLGGRTSAKDLQVVYGIAERVFRK
jgi:transcriptional regulator with XRE-family HTH domain